MEEIQELTDRIDLTASRIIDPPEVIVDENGNEVVDTKLTIDFDQEMAFAKEFYNKAIEGLEPEELPPKPKYWLKYSDHLVKGWEDVKVQIIAEIENPCEGFTKEELDEHEKKIVEYKAFLGCTLCVYMDLMCSICLTFPEQLEHLEMEVKY